MVAPGTYHVHVRAFPDRGATGSVGVALSREGEAGHVVRRFPVSAPHAHAGTLEGIALALAWLLTKGRLPAPVAVHTNMTSVRGVLAGIHTPKSQHRVIDEIRAMLGSFQSFTVTWIGDRENDPMMAAAFEAARVVEGRRAA